MPLTDSEIADWFHEAWTQESHTAPWRPAIETLDADQALWKPETIPVKHSIWEIVAHISFWRDLYLRELDGHKRTSEEVAEGNWKLLTDTSEAAWRQAIEDIDALQQRMTEVIRRSSDGASRLASFIEHDAYHFGQIMLLRAMQGLPPLDSYG